MQRNVTKRSLRLFPHYRMISRPYNDGLELFQLILNAMTWIRFLFVCGLLPLLQAQNPDAEQFFESKIRPVLANNCYTCHTGAKSGGLRLDSRESIIQGGKSGPAIVVGKPDQSLLIQATNHTHARLKMPPGKREKCGVPDRL